MADKTESDPPLRILFVEDVAADVELAESALRKEGLAFTSARVDSKDALLQALGDFRPDVVISEYALPAFDGLQALSVTRAHHPSLPFIVLADAASEETAVACMKAGATDYLLKSRMLRLPFAVTEALAKRGQRMAREQAEDALLDSRNRFQALVETTSDFIWEMDPRGVYTYCSPQLETLWGLNPKEMIGKTPFDLLLPDDAEQALAGFRALLASASPFKDLGVRSFDGAGQVRWLEVSGVPFFDADGRLAGYRGTTRDVTERKRAEEALARDRNLLRTLMESLPDKVYIKDAESRYVLNNLAHLRSLGVKQQEDVLGKTSFDFFPQPLAARYRADEEQVMRSGQPLVEREEAVVNLATGEQAWHLTTKVPLRDDQGKVVGLVGVSRDISRRKRAEEAVRESEERFRLAFMTGMDAFYWATLEEGRILETNPVFEDVFGYPRNEVIGRTSLELGLYHNPVDRARMVAELNAKGFVKDMELAGRKKSGQLITISLSVRPMLVNGQMHILGAIRDITERKQAEATLRESEARLARVLETVPDGVTVVDRAGQITFANSAAEGILGLTRSVVTNRVYNDSSWKITAVDGGPFPEEQLPFVRVMRTHQPVLGVEHAIENRDGKRVVLSINSVPLDDNDGSLIGMVSALTDITERKQVEGAERDQRQLAEALCETAAALNHSLDLDHLLDTILETAGKVLPHDAGEVLLVTPGRRVRDVRHRGYAERGLEEWAKGRDFPLSDFPVLAHIAETRQPLVVSDKHGFPGWANAPEASWFRSHVCAPVIGKDRVTGFISLSSIRPDMYDLEHARRLGAFADQVAVALENASLLVQVRAGREQLRILSRRLLESQEAERRRVARELHDEVGQLLTGLKLVLQMAAAGALQGQMPGLDEAEGLVSELMGRVRQLSLDLRPAMLDDLGLLPALLWHQQRYSQQTRVEVDFKHAGIEGRRFSPEIETAAYRIVQEALTNVARHGGVNQATVRVWGDSEALTVQVEDQGAGFDAEGLSASGKTIGLAGMRERVALLDGQLTLETAPGQGAHLTAVLPLAEPARKRAAGR